MTTKTKTAGLEALRQTEITERQRARDSGVAAETARADAAKAREQLIEAHAASNARAVLTAEKARTVADKQAEDAAIQAEAAQRRADRVDQDRRAFEAEHAKELITELEPAAAEIVAKLERSAAEFAAADQAWSTLRQRGADLLGAIPGASARSDSPGGHALTEVANDLRRVLRVDAEVASPLPHWHGLDYAEAQRSEPAPSNGSDLKQLGRV